MDETPRAEPAHPRDDRRAPWLRRAGIAALVLIVLGLGGWVLRGVVVTALVESALAERGVRCPRIGVDVSWDLSEVAVAQTTCRMGEGAREVEAGLPGGATISVVGWRARTVTIPEVTLSVQGDADREIEDLGGALLDGVVPEPLERALDGLATIARQRDLPHVEVAALRLRRGVRTLDAYDFELTPGDSSISFRLATVAPPAIGERRLEVAAAIAGLEGEASADTAEIRGRVELSLELGPLDVTRGIGFSISGAGLGGPDARYTLSIEQGGELRALRDRIEEMRARRAERQERRQERLDGAVDRVHSLAERLRERVAAHEDAGVPDPTGSSAPTPP